MKLNITRAGELLTDKELSELNKKLSGITAFESVSVIMTVEITPDEKMIWRDKYGDVTSSPFQLKHAAQDAIDDAYAKGWERREGEVDRQIDIRCSACPAKLHFGQHMENSKDLPSAKEPLLVEVA